MLAPIQVLQVKKKRKFDGANLESPIKKRRLSIRKPNTPQSLKPKKTYKKKNKALKSIILDPTFPTSVFEMLKKPVPKPEDCEKVIANEKFVKRNPKRKLPKWFGKWCDKDATATIHYGESSWEKWKLLAYSVTNKEIEMENMIQIKSRGAKRFVQLINCEYVRLRLHIDIVSSNGHQLADALKILEERGKIKLVSNTYNSLEKRTNFKDFRSVEICLPPRSECTFLQLGPPNPKSPFEYKAHPAQWGDPELQPDSSYRWPVPIKINEPFLCSQGFNGFVSHRGKFRYAIDLAVTEGTQIICPRDGLVIDFQNEFTECGQDQRFESKTNYLSIVHKDGTVSEYVHLKHDGVLCELGEFVKKGQIVGYTGNTGWSYGPHLHFHVRNSAAKNSHTKRIAFDNGKKDGIELQTGKYYFRTYEK